MTSCDIEIKLEFSMWFTGLSLVTVEWFWRDFQNFVSNIVFLYFFPPLCFNLWLWLNYINCHKNCNWASSIFCFLDFFHHTLIFLYVVFTTACLRIKFKCHISMIFFFCQIFREIFRSFSWDIFRDISLQCLYMYLGIWKFDLCWSNE